MERERKAVREEQVVSRKTPGDGRLEISAAAAAVLRSRGSELQLRAEGETAPARVEDLACTCGRRGDGEHLHHFLASDPLRALTPGERVDIHADVGSPVVDVRYAGPAGP